MDNTPRPQGRPYVAPNGRTGRTGDYLTQRSQPPAASVPPPAPTPPSAASTAASTPERVEVVIGVPKGVIELPRRVLRGLKNAWRAIPWRTIGRYAKPAAFAVIGLVALAGATAGVLMLTKPAPPIPNEIVAQTTHAVLSPTKAAPVTVDQNTVKYDKSTGILTFDVQTDSGVNVTFTEQPTPESFVDILPAYEALIEKLHGYASFDTPNGKVSLTTPHELSGQQSAVMNSKGTLIFARPTKNLSVDEWKRIFNNLDLQKPQ